MSLMSVLFGTKASATETRHADGSVTSTYTVETWVPAHKGERLVDALTIAVEKQALLPAAEIKRLESK